uniref:Fatty acyl-CoA reductase n=1 Tax=Culicoides sonorensis TaxID=179676 RepID=A0A336MDU5_CULSO
MMNETEKSEIIQFFTGKHVLITGGTGFVGKVIVEKLLRSCPDISGVYLLVREKKGETPHQRFNNYTKHLVFSRVAKSNPKCFEKLRLIKGDVLEEGLGLDDDARGELVENVNVVFHCAATVKFTLPLKESIEFNVLGTYRLLELGKEMKNLVSFVHVSTAYSQEIGTITEERLYPTRHDPLNIIKMTEVLDEPCMELLRPDLMRGNHSNTYTYTKGLAEVLVSKYENVLPVVIARPAIILSSKNEPFTGYTEYKHGPNAVGLGGSYGIIRAMLCSNHNPTCYVPVDYVANATIAVAWDRAEKSRNIPTPFFNIVESETCIHWDKALETANAWLYEHPYSKMMWYPFGRNHENYLSFRIYTIFLHFIPALLIDFLLILFGRKPELFKLYKKADKGMYEYRHFTLNPWRFKNDHLKKLHERLSEIDKKEFDFNLWNMDWPAYIRTYAMGLRTYVGKEPPENIPKTKKLLKKLYILHCFTQIFLAALFAWFLWSFSTPIMEGMNFVVNSILPIKKNKFH